jgi:hypothetical protein
MKSNPLENTDALPGAALDRNIGLLAALFAKKALESAGAWPCWSVEGESSSPKTETQERSSVSQP